MTGAAAVAGMIGDIKGTTAPDREELVFCLLLAVMV
jgi:hypothetical protein